MCLCIAWNANQQDSEKRNIWHMNPNINKSTKKTTKLQLLKTFEIDVYIKRSNSFEMRIFVCVACFNKRINFMPFLSAWYIRHMTWVSSKAYFSCSAFFLAARLVKGFQCFGAQNVHRALYLFFWLLFPFIFRLHNWKSLVGSRKKRITFGKQCSAEWWRRTNVGLMRFMLLAKTLHTHSLSLVRPLAVCSILCFQYNDDTEITRTVFSIRYYIWMHIHLPMCVCVFW